jgi:hypothetical protein
MVMGRWHSCRRRLLPGPSFEVAIRCTAIYYTNIRPKDSGLDLRQRKKLHGLCEKGYLVFASYSTYELQPKHMLAHSSICGSDSDSRRTRLWELGHTQTHRESSQQSNKSLTKSSTTYPALPLTLPIRC